jgi:hypothetical protein
VADRITVTRPNLNYYVKMYCNEATGYTPLPDELTLEEVQHVTGIAAEYRKLQYFNSLDGYRYSQESAVQLKKEEAERRKYNRKLKVRLNNLRFRWNTKRAKLKRKLHPSL